ncbi:hypothetical protein H6503_02715 [Candidatus Woesearchaeota archaeon]|nr:hypothetical protein [Candidatus Woesearchaeota archaeon]
MSFIEDRDIPTIRSLKELEKYVSKHWYHICLYIADKDDNGWEKSTSKKYMNNISEKFVYLPVNIKKLDNKNLHLFLDFAEKEKKIIAVNFARPHKSCLLLKRRYRNELVDTLMKDNNGRLVPYDHNGPAFISWALENFTFKGRSVIIFGVGGEGEPIARHILEKSPENIILVDLIDKAELSIELNNEVLTKKSVTTTVYSCKSLDQIEVQGNIILINCIGKDTPSIESFLKTHSYQEGNIYIDLRPNLSISLVNEASKLGWKGYTGYGMIARNNYLLLAGICKLLNMQAMPFLDFKRLVSESS